MKFNSNYYRGLEGRGAYKSFMGKVAHLPQHAGAWGIWGNFWKYKSIAILMLQYHLNICLWKGLCNCIATMHAPSYNCTIIALGTCYNNIGCRKIVWWCEIEFKSIFSGSNMWVLELSVTSWKSRKIIILHAIWRHFHIKCICIQVLYWSGICSSSVFVDGKGHTAKHMVYPVTIVQ